VPVEVVTPVPPLATGRVPVTCDVRFTPVRAPPRVRFPLDVTVPDNVIPFTVPVPPTEVTVPDTVDAMVMEPVPFVMEMPVPCVSVAFVSVLPVVLPISNCPLVYVV
jgi:hypothetical protein